MSYWIYRDGVTSWRWVSRRVSPVAGATSDLRSEPPGSQPCPLLVFLAMIRMLVTEALIIGLHSTPAPEYKLNRP